MAPNKGHPIECFFYQNAKVGVSANFFHWHLNRKRYGVSSLKYVLKSNTKKQKNIAFSLNKVQDLCLNEVAPYKVFTVKSHYNFFVSKCHIKVYLRLRYLSNKFIHSFIHSQFFNCQRSIQHLQVLWNFHFSNSKLIV